MFHDDTSFNHPLFQAIEYLKRNLNQQDNNQNKLNKENLSEKSNFLISKNDSESNLFENEIMKEADELFLKKENKNGSKLIKTKKDIIQLLEEISRMLSLNDSAFNINSYFPIFNDPRVLYIFLNNFIILLEPKVNVSLGKMEQYYNIKESNQQMESMITKEMKNISKCKKIIEKKKRQYSNLENKNENENENEKEEIMREPDEFQKLHKIIEEKEKIIQELEIQKSKMIYDMNKFASEESIHPQNENVNSFNSCVKFVDARKQMTDFF